LETDGIPLNYGTEQPPPIGPPGAAPSEKLLRVPTECQRNLTESNTESTAGLEPRPHIPRP